VTKGKSHNSILFLTTLGVYLGLVMVGGAAPHVYAHAATTRNFEISDEIEVKDDLDKMPDSGASTLSDSFGVYLQDLDVFLSGLRNLSTSGKFHPGSDAFEVGQTTILPCVPANKVGSYTADAFVSTSETLRPSLEWFSKRLTDGYSLADCLPTARFSGQAATSSKFVLKLDSQAFSVEVGVKKQSPAAAQRLIAALSDTYKLFKPKETDSVRALVYEKTSFRLQNDQVFIVTRLPRGSLDSLPATSAK